PRHPRQGGAWTDRPTGATPRRIRGRHRPAGHRLAHHLLGASAVPDDEPMGVDVQVETTIRRPLGVVSAFAGDPGNAPEWYANIRSVTWQSPPPVAVGSLLDFEARFLGKRLLYTYEVAEMEEGRRLVMR